MVASAMNTDGASVGEMPSSLRILWVKAGRLLPVDTGGKLRSYHLARALAARHQLTLFTFYDGPRDTAYERDLERGQPDARRHRENHGVAASHDWGQDADEGGLPHEESRRGEHGDDSRELTPGKSRDVEAPRPAHLPQEAQRQQPEGEAIQQPWHRQDESEQGELTRPQL